MHALSPAVEALIRDVAEMIVLPRYRTLAAHQIEEKSPGDYVTIADKESELALNAGLAEILSTARMVGEEAAAADPAVLDGLDKGAVWIIDPIDGTGNFAAGQPHFAIMIALAQDGVVQAGWIYDPLRQRMCHAVAGGGAFIDGARVAAIPSGAPLPIAAIATRFMEAGEREALIARLEGHVAITDIPNCAGEQYPRIVLGENDVALFKRTLPWDHAAGALFLAEAGGKVARLDGSPYRIWDGGTGLLGASSAKIWDAAAATLSLTHIS